VRKQIKVDGAASSDLAWETRFADYVLIGPITVATSLCNAAAGSLQDMNKGTLAVASQTGDRNVFMISTASGVDWKGMRFLLIRGEVCNLQLPVGGRNGSGE
jgi:hypothetical protein